MLQLPHDSEPIRNLRKLSQFVDGFVQSIRINLIRFTAQTKHIVSADYDNRVLIRPLHEGRVVTQKRKLRLS